MKLWLDDVRPAPKGYVWCKSVDAAKSFIGTCLLCGDPIKLIDIDHDAGDYTEYGGDYIRLLDWLEECELSYPIHIHSANPVGVANMRRIIRKNGWKEIYD